MLTKRIKSKPIFLIIVFASLNTPVLGQKIQLLTKIFFEFGFTNCDVKVTSKNKILFNGKLNRDSTVTGATKIVLVQGIKYYPITLNICGKVKKIAIKKGMFYKINVIDNKIEVEEVDFEPLYVYNSFWQVFRQNDLMPGEFTGLCPDLKTRT